MFSWFSKKNRKPSPEEQEAKLMQDAMEASRKEEEVRLAAIRAQEAELASVMEASHQAELARLKAIEEEKAQLVQIEKESVALEQARQLAQTITPKDSINKAPFSDLYISEKEVKAIVEKSFAARAKKSITPPVSAAAGSRPITPPPSKKPLSPKELEEQEFQQMLAQSLLEEERVKVKKSLPRLFHAQLNGSPIEFKEKAVSDDGDCALYAIESDRETVVNTLMDHVNDPVYRETLSEEIFQVFLDQSFGGATIFDASLFSEYEKLQNQLNQLEETENQLKMDIKASRNQGKDSTVLLENLHQIKVDIQKAADKKKGFLQSEKVVSAYLEKLRTPRRIYLSVPSLLLFAKATNMNLTVWNQAQKENLVLQNDGSHTGQPGQVMKHIVRTGIHYNQLIEQESPRKVLQERAKASPSLAVNSALFHKNKSNSAPLPLLPYAPTSRRPGQ